MGKADVQNNRNSYYKLQLLEHDGSKKYIIKFCFIDINLKVVYHTLLPYMVTKNFLDFGFIVLGVVQEQMLVEIN